jgi:TPR repeat protein
MLNIRIQRAILISGLALFLSACAVSTQKLEAGKTNFEQKKYSAAFTELKPLAERGNKDAQYAVGYMYFYGRGVDKNKKAAKQWITKAADQGQEQAVKASARLYKKPAEKEVPASE